MVSLCFFSCEETYTPKPRGFQRIDLPKEKTYSDYSSECGFSIKIPSYVTVEPDNHPNAEKCWYNVNYGPFELSGNTATNFQFYVLDSTRHFIRGALYFNSQTNNDSIAPVLTYLKTDIVEMLESLRWK